MKKFIKIPALYKSTELPRFNYINIDMIGHIYRVEAVTNNINKEEAYTNVGVLTHNNGGFRTRMSVEAILKLIEQASK